MSASPEFSVSAVIPVYRGRTTLARAVRSADAQVPPPLEIIVVDNEPDSHLDEIMPATTSTLRLVHEPHRGAAAARNAGLRAAAGRYIAFLDCDDMWEKGFLAAMTGAATRHPRAVLLAGAAEVVRDEETRRVRPGRLQNGGFRRVMFHNSITTSATVVRADAARAAGGFREGLTLAAGCEDWALWLALLRGQQGVAVPRARARRFERGDSPRALGDPALYRDMRRVLDGMFPAGAGRDVPPIALAGVAMRRGVQSLRVGDRRAARAHFVAALHHEASEPRLWAWLAVSILPSRVDRDARRLRNRALGAFPVLSVRGPRGARSTSTPVELDDTSQERDPLPEGDVSGYEPAAYWQSRLTRSFSLAGAGCQQMSPAFLKWQYRAKRASLEAAMPHGLAESDVLDVGPGTGYWVSVWHSVGVRSVSGIDITEVSVQSLRTRFPGDSFERGDISETPPSGGPWNIISAIDVLLHITDPDAYAAALRNLRACAAPGASLLTIDPVATAPPRVADVSHSRVRGVDEVRAALASAGWKLEEVRPAVWLLNDPIEAPWRWAFLALRLEWMVVRVLARNAVAGNVVGAALYWPDRALSRLRCGPTSKLLVATAV